MSFSFSHYTHLLFIKRKFLMSFSFFPYHIKFLFSLAFLLCSSCLSKICWNHQTVASGQLKWFQPRACPSAHIPRVHASSMRWHPAAPSATKEQQWPCWKAGMLWAAPHCSTANSNQEWLSCKAAKLSAPRCSSVTANSRSPQHLAALLDCNITSCQASTLPPLDSRKDSYIGKNSRSPPGIKVLTPA